MDRNDHDGAGRHPQAGDHGLVDDERGRCRKPAEDKRRKCCSPLSLSAAMLLVPGWKSWSGLESASSLCFCEFYRIIGHLQLPLKSAAYPPLQMRKVRT